MRDKAVKLLEDIEANKLPSLPHVLVKLLQACRDDDISFDSLSEIIGQDASLTTKVIKAANSPVYGRARHLNSLKHTLMFLGFDTIKSIAITASIKQFFSEYSNQKTQFLKNFWHHSLSCATISRSLAELVSYPYPEEAYISGLLHDIGKLMIEPCMDAEYRSYEHGSFPADELLKLEKDILGISHPELAAIMLEKWSMPDTVCDAIRYHHASTDEIQQANLLAKLIHFSSLLASSTQSDNHSQTTNAGIRLFDLSEPVINSLVNKAYEEAHSLAASMDIDIGEIENNEKSGNATQKDELKQLQLAQEVRDTALANNSLNTVTTDSVEIFKSIQQSVSLLFGINNSIFLSPDKSLQFLMLAPQQQLTETGLFDELKIDLNEASTIAQCIKNRTIKHSFITEQDNALSIIDEQLAHGLKSGGFICIPVFHNKQLVGALLLGCEYERSLKLLENISLLKLFADNLSLKIQSQLEYTKKLSDLSEKNTELFLNRADKIIHETNNPLTVIKNYLQLLSKKLSAEDPAQADIKTIKQEIDRVSNIILRCKDTPDIQFSEINNININSFLNELIDIYKASLFITHNINCTLNLDKSLKPVQLDENSFKQIITNLLKNSVEAIESDGAITISTGTININGKNYIELKLEDNGPGISDEVMNHLYKPVTTNKGEKHSGIGLSITKNLVDRTGGSISCTTSKKGTVFSVQFPVIK